VKAVINRQEKYGPSKIPYASPLASCKSFQRPFSFLFFLPFQTRYEICDLSALRFSCCTAICLKICSFKMCCKWSCDKSSESWRQTGSFCRIRL